MATLMLAGPFLLASLVIGLVVSVFQAVTSISEMTLTFVPKVVGTALGAAHFGSLDGRPNAAVHGLPDQLVAQLRQMILSTPYFQTLILIFIRAMGFILAAPVLSSRLIPSQVKIGVCALLAFLLAPTDAAHLAGASIRYAHLCPYGSSGTGGGALVGLTSNLIFNAHANGGPTAGTVHRLQYGAPVRPDVRHSSNPTWTRCSSS